MSTSPIDPYDAEIASAAMEAVDATLVAARAEGFRAGVEAAARWVEEASAVMLIDAPEKIPRPRADDGEDDMTPALLTVPEVASAFARLPRTGVRAQGPDRVREGGQGDPLRGRRGPGVRGGLAPMPRTRSRLFRGSDSPYW